jgi:hypothetical protein
VQAGHAPVQIPFTQVAEPQSTQATPPSPQLRLLLAGTQASLLLQQVAQVGGSHRQTPSLPHRSPTLQGRPAPQWQRPSVPQLLARSGSHWTQAFPSMPQFVVDGCRQVSFASQQPLAQEPSMPWVQSQTLSAMHSWPLWQGEEDPHRQAPATHLFTTRAGQGSQVPPPNPQAASSSMWQSVPEQQPFWQLVAQPPQLPLTQPVPRQSWQGLPPMPQIPSSPPP